MPAENQILDCRAGDSVSFYFDVRDQAGALVPLDGSDVLWWCGRSQSAKGDDVLIKKQVGSGLSISGSRVTVAIDPSDTQDVTAGVYYHEAKVFFADGVVKMVLCGPLRLKSTIVRKTG
ncbi:hypothetical protein [Bosea sp. (in: a-proteobacteria)]|uniref:hypothetical protein n=1 Tax=Bosea sp. (in: a-proteobacteria) TaxID=1871050 RepID=UPI001AD09BD8|nr:hypothetical protein [Bosea sp. (in: a-proteobacteria)]MBN9444397.1 hypothetical protein [Bosea sp. (in: a-proteobacteria)]